MGIKCPKCGAENPETATFCADCGTQLLSSEKIEAGPTKTMETPREELTTGSTFADRYQIIEELGKGGMGRVYKANDKEVHTKIALKLIKPEIASDQKTIERFRNELKTARDIAHKNVCRMYDLGKEKGTYFITMEYVSGEDLKSFIHRSGQLTIGTSIKIAGQICNGLSEAHKRGIIHRDLKSNNIMIDKEGNVRIMDFGIARSLSGKGITGAGVMIGTPEYMSPEQTEGKGVDQRSDIYSLGVILYEMVTGGVPFEGETPLGIAMKHKSEPPKNPKELNSQIPEDLSHIILKCLEKDKEKRYQNAAQLQSDLEKIAQGIPTTEKIIPKKKPLTSREITVTFGLKKLLIPALILIAALAAGIIIWQLLPKKEPLPPPTEKRAIAVISFENHTGDQTFDHLRKIIPNLLITNLEQSGYFQVTTWERMYDLLKQIGKEDTEFIDRDLGFELCQMDGVDTIVLGTFGKAADVFATDVKVLDVKTKDLIKSASSTGEGEASILKTQIDELSKEIIKGIGIPESKVASQKIQITNSTTESMEAYKNYIKARDLYHKYYYEDALPYLEKAVEIDPTFLQAYSLLFFTNMYLGNIQARDEALIKAKSLSYKATERGKLSIDRNYAQYIEKDQEKVLAILHQIAKKYPKEKSIHYTLGFYYHYRDPDNAIEEYNKELELNPDHWNAHNQIGYLYLDRKNYEKAIEHFQKYVSLNPNAANPLDSLAEAYFRMGRLDEAIAKYKEALKIKPDYFQSLRSLSYIFALKENYAEALQNIDQCIDLASSAGYKGSGYLLRALYSFWIGQMEKSLLDIKITEDIAKEAGDDDRCVFITQFRACISYEKSDFELSRKHNQDSLKSIANLSPDNRDYFEFVHLTIDSFIDLEQGQLNSAKSKLAEMKGLYPNIIARYRELAAFDMTVLEAEILLKEGSIKKAIDIVESLVPMSPPSQVQVQDVIFYNVTPNRDILAQAYLKSNDPDKAIQEYEHLTTFDPQSENRRLIHPVWYYRLAVLYEQKGWKGKAIENYEKFLTLWKDADPGTKEVEDARERLEGLQAK